MRISKMEKVILQIIDDNSGGLKLTQLISDLIGHYRGKIELADIENELKNLEGKGKIKRLIYTWQSMNREKEFIYTP